MSRYSNQMNIPLPLAVFLATDDYDYDPTAIMVLPHCYDLLDKQY